jgi:hypothetical protein
MVVATAAGCGDSGDGRLEVSGNVAYQGQPVKSGVIAFIPEGAMVAASGAPIIDGRYSIPAESGLLEGDYQVSISVPEGGPVVVEEMPGESVEPKETLPPKYNSQTELRARVQRGSDNRFDFDLK